MSQDKRDNKTVPNPLNENRSMECPQQDTAVKSIHQIDFESLPEHVADCIIELTRINLS